MIDIQQARYREALQVMATANGIQKSLLLPLEE
jgi:hypothetical protein